jgi:hypothetical protein
MKNGGLSPTKSVSPKKEEIATKINIAVFVFATWTPPLVSVHFFWVSARSVEGG